MKKIIVVLFLIIVISVYLNSKESILIPSESIRFRIIANSDAEEDQELKLIIKSDIEKELYELIEAANTIEEARTIIEENLPKVEEIMDKYNVEYDISFGNNYFPEKVYKGVTYDAGNYEGLVITIGEGLGQNWWCVLFPPLCLLDENTNLEDVEYEWYVKKIINNFK